jgi:hypothetical protein
MNIMWKEWQQEKEEKRRGRRGKGDRDGWIDPTRAHNRRSSGTSRRPHSALGILGLLLRSDQHNKGSNSFKYTCTAMLPVCMGKGY